jgi:tetratricopeptide (TPR) repeat protein
MKVLLRRGVATAVAMGGILMPATGHSTPPRIERPGFDKVGPTQSGDFSPRYFQKPVREGETPAQAQKPWFVRWIKTKAQLLNRLSDPRKAVGAALRLLDAMDQTAGNSLPIGFELQESPLDALIENKKLVDDKELKLHFDRGRIRAGNKQYKEAIDDFNECIRRDPTSAGCWAARGAVWGAQGEYEKAIRDFDRAIQLQSKFAFAYKARGLCRLANRDAVGAAEDFEQLIACDPQAAAFAFRGLAKMSRIRYREAIGDFDRARELDPNGPQFLLWRAVARFNNREFAWAIEDLDQMLALHPQYAAQAIFFRGLAWGQIGQTAKAQVDLHEAGRLDPSYLNQMHLLKAANLRFVVSAKNMEWNVVLVGQTRASRTSPLFRPAPAVAAAGAPANPTPTTEPDLKSISVAEKTFDASRFSPEFKKKAKESPATRADQTPAPASTENNRPRQSPAESPRVLAAWLSSADQEVAKSLTLQAWLLATSRYESGRDGVRAVEAARAACELTEWRAWGCVEALAAAYAECGDFESADKYQTLAEELAATGPSDARHAAARRHALYRDRRPVHQGE